MSNRSGVSMRRKLAAHEFKDEKIRDVAELEPGDHIYVPGNSGPIGKPAYYHHAIYIGIEEGTRLVTDIGKGMLKPVIRNFYDFLGEHTKSLFRRIYKIATVSTERIIEAAKKFCNESFRFGRYHLLKNNCEHYATMLKLGFGDSTQVKKATKIAAVAGVGLIVAGLVGIGAYNLRKRKN